jgi:lysophospholipase L1-like esterase
MRVRALALLSAAVLFVLAALPASANEGRGDDQAGYLALGDSVAFGYSPLLVYAGLAGNPAVFVGYPDIAARSLDLNLANASCPGETTGGFLSITNGLDYACLGYRFGYHFPLHVSYPGAQLDYAIQYLSTHHDVRLVTMDIGANDVFKLQTACGGVATACFASGLPDVLTGIDTNLRIIYNAIRNVAHYHHKLVTLTYYSLAYDATTAAGTKTLNKPIIDASNAYDATIASGFNAFKSRALATPHKSSCEAGLLIVLTPAPKLTCDVHPTPLGRDLLARAIVRAVENGDNNQDQNN